MKRFQISTFPHATPDKPQFAKMAIRETVNFTELHNLVMESAWSPAILKENMRSTENFESCSVIALDFDGELSIYEAQKRLELSELQYSMTLSKSHQKKKNGVRKDRFRLIVPLSSQITDKETYSNTWNKLFNLFPEIDEQCKDPARFYFNSTEEVILQLEGKLLDPVEQVNEPTAKTSSQTAVNNSERAMLGPGVLLFLRNAATGMDGKWNKALFVAAKECARGGFTKEDATTLLESVCPTPFDERDEKAFNSGWKAGTKAGLYASVRKVGKKETSEMLYDFLEEELENSYHVLEDEKGRRGIVLKEEGNGVVSESSTYQISSVLGKLARDHFGIFLDAKESKQHADNYVLYTEPLLEEPKTVLFNDEPGMAYHKLDFSPQEGDCPLFDELISRTTNGDALKAFIWSLFLPDSDRQQYIWLCGQGGNGKTSLQRFLERCLGSACVEKRVGSIHNNRFFTHSLVGKRLAVFSDTNSATIVRSETIKEITGGGRVEVEPKGAAPFSINLDVKLIFISNNAPDISSKNADLRRLIMCQIDPLPESTVIDSNYSEHLWNERAAILQSCKDAYNKLKANLGSIPCDTLVSEDVADESELPMEVIFDTHFELDANESVSAVELYKAVELELSRKKIKRSDFYDWMKRKFDIEYKQVWENGRNVKVYQGIKLK